MDLWIPLTVLCVTISRFPRHATVINKKPRSSMLSAWSAKILGWGVTCPFNKGPLTVSNSSRLPVAQQWPYSEDRSAFAQVKILWVGEFLVQVKNNSVGRITLCELVQRHCGIQPHLLQRAQCVLGLEMSSWSGCRRPSTVASSLRLKVIAQVCSSKNDTPMTCLKYTCQHQDLHYPAGSGWFLHDGVGRHDEHLSVLGLMFLVSFWVRAKLNR